METVSKANNHKSDRINYKNFLKLSINEEHKCVAINVVAREFKKQKDYTEFYSEVDSIMVKSLRYAKEKFNKTEVTILADLSGFMIKHVDYGFFKEAIDCFKKALDFKNDFADTRSRRTAKRPRPRHTTTDHDDR